MKQLKRMLSLVLALALLLSLLPTAVWAEREPDRGGGGGGAVWICDFEDEHDLIGWQILNANNDAYSFVRTYDEANKTWCLRSGSQIREDTSSLHDSDDYLISPRIDLADPDLEYSLDLSMAGILNGSYNATYYLYIYTGDELLRADNLHTLLGHAYQYGAASFDVFQNRRFDLTAFRGRTVQVVLRHRDDLSSILKLGSAAVYWGEPDEIMGCVTAVDVPLPQVGVNVDSLKESDITFPDFANYELVPGSLTYYKSAGETFDEIHNEVFEADGEYQLSFKVRPKPGIELYSDCIASVNGEHANCGCLSEENVVEIVYFQLPPLTPKQEILEVNLRVDPPLAGTAPDKTVERWLADGSTDYHYSILWVDWYPESEVFESGASSYLSATIRPDDGWVLTDDTHYTINGEFAYTYDLMGIRYVELAFDADYEEPIPEAAVTVPAPAEGMTPTYGTEASDGFFVQDAIWYPLSQWGTIQPMMQDGEVFDLGTTYRYTVRLRPYPGRQFTPDSRVTINGIPAVPFRLNIDGFSIYTVDLKAGPREPVTVTFNAHGHGTAPDPVVIPCGSSLWDSVYDLTDLRMEDTDGMIFWGWSEYATDRRDDRISWEHAFYEDTTLYAVWQEDLSGVKLYVDQPIVLDPIDKPYTSVTSEYGFSPEPLGWWDSADGYREDEEPLTGTFQLGKTYYGVVLLEPDLYSTFVEGADSVSVIGAKEVREDWVDDPEDGPVVYVTFSVTIPRRGAIDEIDLLVDIGWKGWLMYGTQPTQLCLTPGVSLDEGSWWENPEDVGDESKAITGRFPTGCPVYTAAQLWPSLNCGIDFENLTVRIDGGTLIRTERIGSSGVQVIYSVWSPDYHGMEFFTRGSGWFFVDDNPHARRWHEGPFFETGLHTVTALPDPGWHFVGWYEGPDADVLVSTDPVYVFENEPADDDLRLTAVFEEGILPVDLVEIEVPIPSAGDSFYWTDSAGALVTNGARVTITKDTWYNEWGISGEPLTFEEGQNYFVEIELVAESGYEITEDTVVRINGEDVVWKQQSNVVTWSFASRNYTMTAPIPIETVDIQVSLPLIGDSFWYDTDSAGALVTNGAPVEICEDKWVTDGGVGGNPLPFEEGFLYRLSLVLKTEPGYAFTDQTVIRINGEPADRMILNNAHSCSAASRTMAPTAPKPIETLDIQIHHIPAAGETFDPDYDVVFASTMEQIEWISTIWRDAEMGPDTSYPLTFQAGKQYYASFVIHGAYGWEISDDTVFTIDGEPAADWTKVALGTYRLDSRFFTVHEEQVIPTVEVYANKPVYDIAPSEPYIPEYEPYEVEDWAWSDANGFALPKDFTVMGGIEYTLTVMVKPKEGYMFSADEISARLFWDDVEIVSVEPHLLTIRASAVAGMGTPNPFVDVEKGKFYYEPVLWAYYHDPQITAGTDATHFSPSKDCTRGQVVTFLWRAAGCPEPTQTTHPFTDVKEGAYYYTAMLWAVENGITTGTSATTFSPNKACTRGQVVTFLWRAEGSPEPESTSCPFTDVKPTASYYKAVLWAVEQGVTTGTSATAFSPSKTCNRGQVVTFLFRVYGPKG